MEGAYSANTIRSYRADFTIFEAWCLQRHLAALCPACHAGIRREIFAR
jgi:site-specific recombinase XerD